MSRSRKSGPIPQVVDLDLIDEFEEELDDHGVADLEDQLTAFAAAEPVWTAHDRTHLEFAVNYRFDGSRAYAWDAYFFLPSSLQIDEASYGHEEIYRDLQSYVRYSVPLESLATIAETIPSGREGEEAARKLRVWACKVRAATHASESLIRENISTQDWTTAVSASRQLVAEMQTLTDVFRSSSRSDEDLCRRTMRLIDEDISRLFEHCCAGLASKFERKDGHQEIARVLGQQAVFEARYRRDGNLGATGKARSSRSAIEHLEFRRHLLKRFVTSVLYLSHEVHEAQRWILHFVYAIAAGVAMMFAVAAALFHGQGWRQSGFDNLWYWGAAVVLAYAAKDRIKASLQATFSSWIARRFPDRKWVLCDPKKKVRVGNVVETSLFLDEHNIPEDALALRYCMTKRLLTQPQETIFWHQKRVDLQPSPSARFDAVTEVFRLDLSPWLVHTDDPKNRLYFADPEREEVYSARAPRVYNINVVYRLRQGDDTAPWRRVRVVVSRKGIHRIETVVDSAF